MDESVPASTAATYWVAARPSAAGSVSGEPYVPLRKEELIRVLIRHGAMDRAEADRFARLCRLIETVFHMGFHAKQEQLKTLYAPFDPDSATRPIADGTGRTRQDMIDEFLEQLVQLLRAAHYQPLTQRELDYAMTGATYWGLDLEITPDIFDRLLIYVRGDVRAARVRRDLSTFFRRREIELEVYQRLVLGVKLRPSKLLGEEIDTESIYLKLFREIPKLDLEMLLPGTRPRMRWIDTAKISGSSITGIYGLVRVALTTIFMGKVKWLMVALGAFSYGWQSFFGYRRTKAQYLYSLTQQLYYQNLDNNMGVFCRLIDEAEDEETKEAILAYYLLWYRAQEGWTSQSLACEIERILRQLTGEDCQFQVQEALGKLEQLGVLIGTGDTRQVLPPDRAVERLRQYCADTLARAD